MKKLDIDNNCKSSMNRNGVSSIRYTCSTTSTVALTWVVIAPRDPLCGLLWAITDNRWLIFIQTLTIRHRRAPTDAPTTTWCAQPPGVRFPALMLPTMTTARLISCGAQLLGEIHGPRLVVAASNPSPFSPCSFSFLECERVRREGVLN
jgi:hypothetical protein